MTTRDDLRREVMTLRRQAVADFDAGVEGLIAKIRRQADAMKAAIGECSTDEVWCALAATITAWLSSDVHQWRVNTRTRDELDR